MNQLILKPKNDLIFKLILEKNKENLINFLIATLDINREDVKEVQVLNPYSKMEKLYGKTTISDLKAELTLTQRTQMINLEIQLLSTRYMKERLLFGLAKSVTEQKNRGDNYKLKKVISILITDYILEKDHNKYHDVYRLSSDITKTMFSDNIEVHTIEIPKLPKKDDGTNLYNWVSFLKAETEQEIAMIAKKAPIFEDIIFTLKELSEDEATRLAAEARDAALWDQAGREEEALERGIQQGKIEGIEQGKIEGIEQGIKNSALKMYQKGHDIKFIADILDKSEDWVQMMLESNN